MQNEISNTSETIQIQFSGQISIDSSATLKALFAEVMQSKSALTTIAGIQSSLIDPKNAATKDDTRLAYTMRETAAILGVSYITVHRLIKRGLLRRSSALRCILIPKREMERFLKETLSGDWR